MMSNQFVAIIYRNDETDKNIGFVCFAKVCNAYYVARKGNENLV